MITFKIVKSNHDYRLLILSNQHSSSFDRPRCNIYDLHASDRRRWNNGLRVQQSVNNGRDGQTEQSRPTPTTKGGRDGAPKLAVATTAPGICKRERERAWVAAGTALSEWVYDWSRRAPDETRMLLPSSGIAHQGKIGSRNRQLVKYHLEINGYAVLGQ